VPRKFATTPPVVFTAPLKKLLDIGLALMVKWAPVCAKFAHTPLIGRKGLSRTIYKAMCKFLGDSNVQILHIANFWGIAIGPSIGP
jgi:hypothetical protein